MYTIRLVFETKDAAWAPVAGRPSADQVRLTLTAAVDDFVGVETVATLVVENRDCRDGDLHALTQILMEQRTRVTVTIETVDNQQRPKSQYAVRSPAQPDRFLYAEPLDGPAHDGVRSGTGLGAATKVDSYEAAHCLVDRWHRLTGEVWEIVLV